MSPSSIEPVTVHERGAGPRPPHRSRALPRVMLHDRRLLSGSPASAQSLHRGSRYGPGTAAVRSSWCSSSVTSAAVRGSSAGSLQPSHVVTALGVEHDLANSLVRFSLGRDSTLEEVEYVEQVLPQVIRRAQVVQ